MKRSFMMLLAAAVTVCIWGQPKYSDTRQDERRIAEKNAKQMKANEELKRISEIVSATLYAKPPKPIKWEDPSPSTDIKTLQMPDMQHEPSHCVMIVDSLLKEKMQSSLNIDSSLVIVMDIWKDDLVAMIGMRKEEGAHNIDYWIGGLSPTSIMRAATYLAVLENGGKPEDTIDTGNGIYVTNSGDSIFDHNFRRGGYGLLSLERGFTYKSDIVQARSIEMFLPNGYKTLAENLRNMGVKYIGDFSDYQSLKKAKIHPQHMLDWMNSVAKGDVPNVSKENVVKLQDALFRHVEEGLGKGARSGTVRISGTSCSAQTEKPNNYFLSFVGFFPSDDPQYSIYVELYKNGKPASASFAAELFRDIAEQMTN